MAKYKVTVSPISFSYEIEATDEDTATDKALELSIQESQYDLLKWADYEVTEVK